MAPSECERGREFIFRFKPVGGADAIQHAEVAASYRNIARSGSQFFVLRPQLLAVCRFDSRFEWLEKAYQLRDDELGWILIDPSLDNMRSDPRYADLLRRMGLPQ
jgi:hypothetical protein